MYEGERKMSSSFSNCRRNREEIKASKIKTLFCWAKGRDYPLRALARYSESVNMTGFTCVPVFKFSELKKLPSSLHSLRIEGFDASESLPLFGSHVSVLHELYIGDSSVKSFPRGCLPKTLKHLYIYDCRKLESFLPSKMVHQFETLEMLIIKSSCDSLTSLELSFFPKLQYICLSSCENIKSISSKNPTSLEELEIRECPNLVSFHGGRLHAPKLRTISICNCEKLKSLPQQMHALLPSLLVLILSDCPQIASFPEGGLLSSLFTISISSCNELVPRIEWNMHGMPSLTKFEIMGGCGSMDSFPEEGLLPSSLLTLHISSLPNLKFLNHKGLQCLSSLKTLRIDNCNNLSTLPRDSLPESLSSLIIRDCPLLKRDIRPISFRLAKIPCIQIDGEVVSDSHFKRKFK